MWVVLYSFLLSNFSYVSRLHLAVLFFTGDAKSDAFLGVSFLDGVNDASRGFCVEHHESIIISDDAVPALDAMAHQRAVTGVRPGFLKQLVARILSDTTPIYDVPFGRLGVLSHG